MMLHFFLYFLLDYIYLWKRKQTMQKLLKIVKYFIRKDSLWCINIWFLAFILSLSRWSIALWLINWSLNWHIFFIIIIIVQGGFHESNTFQERPADTVGHIHTWKLPSKTSWLCQPQCSSTVAGGGSWPC